MHHFGSECNRLTDGLIDGLTMLQYRIQYAKRDCSMNEPSDPPNWPTKKKGSYSCLFCKCNLL